MSIEAEFDSTCQRILLADRKTAGIGGLGERGLHKILKCFIEPDESRHEIKVEGFVADILRGDEIVEIQTRDFSPLRRKLPVYLKNYRVTVVYSIAREKRIHWIDPTSGEVSGGRRSPKTGGIGEFLLELYKLRPILPLDGLCFELYWLDVDEFRMLTGRSRDRKHYGAYRRERIPTRLDRIERVASPDDYLEYIKDLGDSFTCAEFAKALSMYPGAANRALQTLVTLGVVERIGKRKNAYIYERKSNRGE